ncbi:hypothetical protein BHQ21_03250 [Mycobacterium sherrisii]|uniref:AB hydrolase-1 domain-containing protein n=1 Tax=Mycobacterium sherrisii TaxID=243061 RepID=A0A1E3T6L8_9MYCO|nr:alpha/beta fold hydrolase [Mycobacterium sherrisii]ODR10129.1 hypothetical protein BHQ21_03250 [Mycobacterium sherrisii]
MTDGLTSTTTSITDINGNRARIRVAGAETAPPVLMLHGLGRSLEDWCSQHDLLSAYRTIAVDMPGFGYSTPPKAPMSVDVLAQGVIGITDRIIGERQLCVIGNSLGGAVALQLLVNHPDRVASLVLVDAAGFGRKVHPLIRMLATPVIGSFAAKHPNRFSAALTERLCCADPELVTQQRIDQTLAIARTAAHSDALHQTARFIASPIGMRSGWRNELLARATSHTCPTLVVWGGRDRILPPTQLAAAHRALPDTETHIFEGVGHMPQLECPEAFAAVVSNFLTRSRRTLPN